MYRTSRTPLVQRAASLVTIGAVVLSSCGSETTTPQTDATTLAPTTEGPDVTASTRGDEAADSTEPEEPSDTITPPDTAAPATDAPVFTATQQALADVAIGDVVERRGVDAADVVVIGVEEVTWPDASLGCPRKDMQYQQVLTPGVRVIVEADGQRAFYHGTSVRDLAYCAAPRPPLDA